MTLKHILALLTELEAEGKLASYTLTVLYDPNGDITLTVRAVDVATREQFLADVAGTVDEAKPEAEDAPVMGKFVSDGVHVNAKTTVKAKVASKAAKHKS